MGRRNRRRPPPDQSRSGDGRLGPQALEEHPDGLWVVRRVSGAAATKPYRCPGCDHEIRPATPHVVAWPAEEDGAGRVDGDGRAGGDLSARRHWHSGCWAARDRRGPAGPKGRPPRY